MTTVRWGRALMQALPSPPKVRWGSGVLTGNAPTISKVRWGRATLTGNAAVVVNPTTDQTVEPETVVTIAATLAGGGSPDSWTFRRVSGPAIGIEGTGATRTFRAPSTMSGADVVIGVRATIAGVISPEVTCTVTVLPQLSWAWDGTAFVGSQVEYLTA